ncbi:MAG: radical SAM protein [Patescibacteria group bacterium]|mgnify:CR=1 FL=1
MFDGKIKTTEYASLVVTHECNKSCPFCIDRYRGRREYITIPIVESSLKIAKEAGIKDILIVGGEPTLHPNIVKIAKTVKRFGFRVILTTNYSNPDAIRRLDGIVDCFNISFYDQKDLPRQSSFISDMTIATLIYKSQLETKEKLDRFIDKYSGIAHLKFSTLSICNKFTKENQAVGYLDELKARKIVLFDEIEGLIYRDCIIKRYDRPINPAAYQSIKIHVDGEISHSWDRNFMDDNYIKAVLSASPH